jgi:hypothetical protein
LLFLLLYIRFYFRLNKAHLTTSRIVPRNGDATSVRFQAVLILRLTFCHTRLHNDVGNGSFGVSFFSQRSEQEGERSERFVGVAIVYCLFPSGSWELEP